MYVLNNQTESHARHDYTFLLTTIVALFVLAFTIVLYDYGIVAGRTFFLTASSSALIVIMLYSVVNYFTPISTKASVAYSVITNVVLVLTVLMINPITLSKAIPILSYVAIGVTLLLCAFQFALHRKPFAVKHQHGHHTIS